METRSLYAARPNRRFRVRQEAKRTMAELPTFYFYYSKTELKDSAKMVVDDML